MARPECDTPLVLNWHHFCRKMEVIQAMATWKSKSTWRSVGISLEILSNSLMRAESCSWAEHFCWVSERERERERECEWVGWFVAVEDSAILQVAPLSNEMAHRAHGSILVIMRVVVGSACELDTHLLNFWWFLGPICWWWGERGGMDLWKVK